MNVLLPESFRLPVCREISGLCFELLQYLSCPAQKPALPAILQNVLEKLRQDYGKSIEMKSLADSSGISVSTLTRLFKQHLGKTPHQYLIGLRMRQAARLLEQNSFSVKEIAGLVGYGNALNFSTEFRKFFGRSPRSWRTAGSSPTSRR
nr:AraC family transcriptional regulator [Victivallis lenta]